MIKDSNFSRQLYNTVCFSKLFQGYDLIPFELAYLLVMLIPLQFSLTMNEHI